MASVWGELKRRNVVRVMVAYAVVAWLLIEVSTTTFPMLTLPEWAATLVTVLLMIGFPVALLFAWAFELTPEGLKKEKDVDRSESITNVTGRRLDFAIIGVLAVAVVFLVSEKFIWTDDVGPSPQTEASNGATEEITKSIAVLPFVNMSGDVEQEYFADGITEEILNALAGVRELAVTSRTSAFAFKGKSVSIPKIAQELGVAHVLEGSVRKSGDRLRITAQLIEVASDTHLWSETYDRELTDIFALQDEISANITAALKLNLLGGTAARAGAVHVNPEAYDLYLRGLQEMAAVTYGSLAKATNYLEQALAIDSTFVRAYAGLGWAYEYQVGQGSVTLEVNLPKIRQVIRRGLDIEPDNAGLIGLSGVMAYKDGDFEKAELLLHRALALDPPHFHAPQWYSNTLMNLGRMAESLQVGMDWFEADPLNPQALVPIAFNQLAIGRVDDAIATSARLKTIAANNPYADFIYSLAKLSIGDLAAFISAQESAFKIEPNDHEAISLLAIGYYSIGEIALGDAWVQKGRQIAPDATIVTAADAYGLELRGELTRAEEISLKALASHRQFDRWWGGFITLRFAVNALIDRGEPMRAVDMILEAEPAWAAFRNNSPSEAQHLSANPGFYGNTAQIINYFSDFARPLRAAGDDTGADNILAHMEAIQNWQGEHGMVVSESRAAEIHALRGRGDDALDALERAEKDGSIYVYWHYQLIYNRIFDDIRDQPRFKALVQRVKDEMQRQRTEYVTNRLPRDKLGEALDN